MSKFAAAEAILHAYMYESLTATENSVRVRDAVAAGQASAREAAATVARIESINETNRAFWAERGVGA
jgi:hypothetical protein